jgi:hypothetical protein
VNTGRIITRWQEGTLGPSSIEPLQPCNTAGAERYKRNGTPPDARPNVAALGTPVHEGLKARFYAGSGVCKSQLLALPRRTRRGAGIQAPFGGGRLGQSMDGTLVRVCGQFSERNEDERYDRTSRPHRSRHDDPKPKELKRVGPLRDHDYVEGRDQQNYQIQKEPRLLHDRIIRTLCLSSAVASAMPGRGDPRISKGKGGTITATAGDYSPARFARCHAGMGVRDAILSRVVGVQALRAGPRKIVSISRTTPTSEQAAPVTASSAWADSEGRNHAAPVIATPE